MTTTPPQIETEDIIVSTCSTDPSPQLEITKIVVTSGGDEEEAIASNCSVPLSVPIQNEMTTIPWDVPTPTPTHIDMSTKHPQYEAAQAAFKSAEEAKQNTAARLELARAAVEASSVENQQSSQDTYDQALSEDQELAIQLSLAQQEFIELDLQVPGQWNLMYGKLVTYKEKYGHCKVSQDRCFGKETKTSQKRRKSDDFNDADPDLQILARWVGNQRVFYKYFQNGDTKHIKAHRIDALKSLGFVWDIKEHRWMEWYYQLKAFKNIHGHIRLSSKDNRDLHHWVSRQQREYSKMQQGAPYSLSTERIRLLTEIDFDFEMCKVSKRKTALTPEDLWELKYGVLKAFHKEHGHSRVNVRSLSSSHNLTDWVAYLRNQYLTFQDGKPSMLNQGKITMLEALDFQWKKPLSIPRKNCGVKKRKGEENEKVRRVSNGSEDSKVDTAVVADDIKEEKEEEVEFSLKIRRISGTIDTNVVKYEIENIDTPISSTIDTDGVKYEIENTDTPIVMKDVKYKIHINTPMATDENVIADTLMVADENKIANAPHVPDVVEDVKEVSNLPQQTGQSTISFENDIIDTAIVPNTNEFFCC